MSWALLSRAAGHRRRRCRWWCWPLPHPRAAFSSSPSSPAAESESESESRFVHTADGHALHVRRFPPTRGAGAKGRDDEEGCKGAVLLLHGAIENSRIFYPGSSAGKRERGLARFLSRCGWDAYCLDFRGRGQSTPTISREHGGHGMTEVINDIPLVHEAVREWTGLPKIHWMAHSWAGVLAQSALVRHPESLLNTVASQTTFGTKRVIKEWNLTRLYMIELGWGFLCPLACKIFGYLPAKTMRIGDDSETERMVLHSDMWVRGGPWHGEDGFDYLAANQAIPKEQFPPVMIVSAKHDAILGNPKDVERFRVECGYEDQPTLFLQDPKYDHITMLTHRDCVNEHFPDVERFLMSQA